MSSSEKPISSPAIKFDLTEQSKRTPPKLEPVKQTRFHWFASGPGRRAVGTAVAVASLGVTLVKAAPHSIALNYVKDIFQNYTEGFRTRPSKDMVGLVDDVCEDIGLSIDEKVQLNSFVMAQTEPYAWGGMWKKGGGHGVLLGYPEFFHWTSPEDVPMAKMRVGSNLDSGTNVGFSRTAMASPEAKIFRDSMILSDGAKKFSICREIERTRTFSFIFSSTLPGCWMGLTYLVSRYANHKLGLFKAPFRPLHRLIAYISILPAMSFTYFLIKDAHQRNLQGSIDLSASGLSREYAAGGVEYYTKLMARNASLRALDPSMKDSYNLLGDLKPGIIRMKHKPLMERKMICEDMLAKFGDQ